MDPTFTRPGMLGGNSFVRPGMPAGTNFVFAGHPLHAGLGHVGTSKSRLGAPQSGPAGIPPPAYQSDPGNLAGGAYNRYTSAFDLATQHSQSWGQNQSYTGFPQWPQYYGPQNMMGPMMYGAPAFFGGSAYGQYAPPASGVPIAPPAAPSDPGMPAGQQS